MHPIKLICFDLDGVLVSSRVMHYETFKQACSEILQIEINWQEHESEFDGLSTKKKTEKLIQQGRCTSEQAEKVYSIKQQLTQESLSYTVKPRETLSLLLSTLKNQGFLLYCCSNSIRQTLNETLRLLQIQDYFDQTLSNEDVREPKPSPEMYAKAMELAQVSPHETLIIEDSPVGRKAAYASGAYVLEVEDTEDLTLSLIRTTLYSLEKNQVVHHRYCMVPQPLVFHVVIPMAGEGSRFKQAGYKEPKPFIPVGGKPMIQWVIQNMLPKDNPSGLFKIKFHLIVRTAQVKANQIDRLFWDTPSNVSYTVHYTDGLTEGAACSVILAESQIDNDEPLMIVNSDQYLEWSSDSFYKSLLNPEYDGCILTFYQPDPYDKKWSYAKINADNLVSEVAEKKWISPYATVGLYGWKRGSDFVRYAKQMISKNIRVNNEFYVCPVYNEAIQEGKQVRVKLCSGMWGLGVPEDLEKFKKEYLKEPPRENSP